MTKLEIPNDQELPRAFFFVIGYFVIRNFLRYLLCAGLLTPLLCAGLLTPHTNLTEGLPSAAVGRPSVDESARSGDLRRAHGDLRRARIS